MLCSPLFLRWTLRAYGEALLRPQVSPLRRLQPCSRLSGFSVSHRPFSALLNLALRAHTCCFFLKWLSLLLCQPQPRLFLCSRTPGKRPLFQLSPGDTARPSCLHRRLQASAHTTALTGSCQPRGRSSALLGLGCQQRVIVRTLVRFTCGYLGSGFCSHLADRLASSSLA